MSQEFCFGMMVTQMVLFTTFIIGIVYIIGYEIVRLVKK